MGWLARLLGREIPDPADPSAAVAAALARMGSARAEAEAVRAEAIEDYRDPALADRFLVHRVPFLGHRRPIDLLKTARGRAAVRDVLYRMRHGIFS